MTSRLRRMLLINVKTSGVICSGSITEVDPRGGACITGDNGVGKTTTLQLIPLFFGYSPNQLVHASGNLEPMLRFVLPHPQCALVYEYQRGDEATDIHQVVIRRQNGNDAAEYRFIAGPFNKSVFTEQLSTEAEPVFLSDEGSVEAATRLGLHVSPKLNAAAFRNVILNLRSVNKDAESIRRLTNQYSFSARHLPYLDRLVASVVKEQVDFRDLTDVAVTMVLERMGGFGKPGVNQHRLPVKQGKEQIERWLRNRDACERAFKVREDVEILRDRQKSHRAMVLKLGELHGDVRSLAAFLEGHVEATQKTLTTLDLARASQVQEQEASGKSLQVEETEAKEAFQKANLEYTKARDRKRYFEDEDATHWASEAERLPLLRSQSEQMLTEIENLTKQAEGITRRYAQEIAALDTLTADTKVEILAAKQVHAEQVEAELAELHLQEEAVLAELRDIHHVQTENLQKAVGEIDVQVGAARAKLSNPQISSVIEDRLKEARTNLNDHMQALNFALEVFSGAQDTLSTAKTHFERAELALGGQMRSLDEAKEHLERSKQQLSPPPGTLHAAFLAATDEDWKRSVARVIDPALLSRDDLKPQHVQDVASGLYGWDLDLNALQTPVWANNEALQALVTNAASHLVRMEVAERDARAQLERTSVAQMQAQQVFNAAEATLSILKGKTASLKFAQTTGEEDVRRATDDARSEAKTDLARIEAFATSERRKLAELAKTQGIEKKSVVDEFRTAREQANARKKAADASIDARAKEYVAGQAELRKQLESQRDRALTDEGVDVGRLNSLRKSQTGLATEIRTIGEHAPLVHAFKEWLQSSGPARLVDLQHQAQRHETQYEDCKLAVTRHDAVVRSSQQQYNTQRSNIEGVLRKLDAETKTLEELGKELKDYTPSIGTIVARDGVTPELVGRFNQLKTDLQELVQDINSRSKRVDGALTSHESAVKDFMVACLEDLGSDASVVQRAERLTQAYDRIGREVLSHVNGELNTILASIAQFRSRILSFETEVAAFNTQLQEGLNGVVNGFSRIRDFKIAVVTDFETLDFMGKLKALDDVVRYHREQHRATHSLEVPPATSAYALRDFMEVIGSGTIEIDLGAHITLSGSINDDGNVKPFHRESELKSVSSNGLTAITLITLLTGLLNVIRGKSGKDDIHIPWVTDEVGKYDGPNFATLMQMLRDNRIDVVTASPTLTPAAYKHFARRYLFRPHGGIAIYRPAALAQVATAEVKGDTK